METYTYTCSICGTIIVIPAGADGPEPLGWHEAEILLREEHGWQQSAFGKWKCSVCRVVRKSPEAKRK